MCIRDSSCNVKGDAFKDINHTLTLGAVPLGGVGMLTLAMEYNLSGEATRTVEKEFEAGFAYSDGFRIVEMCIRDSIETG